MTEHNRRAAINLLPFEILGIIFYLVVGNRALLTMDYFRSPHELATTANFSNQAAIRLTHVCTLWREFARAQPLLWNTIVTMRGVWSGNAQRERDEREAMRDRREGNSCGQAGNERGSAGRIARIGKEQMDRG